MFSSLTLEKMLVLLKLAGFFFYLFYLCFFTKVLMCYFKEPERISCNICKLTRVDMTISYKIGNKWGCRILHYKNVLKDPFKTLKTLFIKEEE